MKPKKNIKILKIMQIALLLLFLLVVYFLTPYILPIFNVKSYVIVTYSMTHKNQSFFESVYANKSVDPAKIPFRYGINIGDLVIVRHATDYKIGDVISFKTVAGGERTTHRIYELNSTHFADMGDVYLEPAKSDLIWLVLRDGTISATDEPGSVMGADRVYQAPAYEKTSQLSIPLSYIEGKVVFVLPKAGMLHLLIYPYEIPQNSR